MCRRALEPCSGLWTLPAGYMELAESTAGMYPPLCNHTTGVMMQTSYGCSFMCMPLFVRRQVYFDCCGGGKQRCTPDRHFACMAGLISVHTAEGAARETLEEANASVDIVAPYAHLDIPVIGQAYIFFRAHLAAPYTYSSGPESQDVSLFSPEEIPFDSIAFSSVYITLKRWVDDRKRGMYSIHHGVIRKKPGASIRDQSAFQFVDSYEVDLHSAVTKT